MEVLVKYFQKLQEDIQRLQTDIQRIQKRREQEVAHKTDENIEVQQIILKSFQPVTRLRGSKEELMQAQEDPDITFINDKLKDIFG